MKKSEFIAKYGEDRYNEELERHRKWNHKNKEYQNSIKKIKRLEQPKSKTERANSLIMAYRKSDKDNNKGECTLTKQQLIGLWDNGCYWCGEKDWQKLGADRIDNSKPHTLENCVCSCWECNNKRGLDDRKKVIIQYNLDMEPVCEFESASDASRKTNIPLSNISFCCNGKYKTAGGFIWKYKTTKNPSEWL